MNFTPKRWILTIAAVGLIAWAWQVTPARAQPNHWASDQVTIVPAIDTQPGMMGVYQPVKSWYKRKSWWKKNAPIIGGAGGGALVGGLVGGGTGAVIGGAAGGGGGYLYKRHKRHNDKYKYRYR